MAMTPQVTEKTAKEGQEQAGLSALIVEWVLHTLGEPADLYAVQVRPLWDDRFRVNVLVGPNAASARVAHSYFVVASRDGDIVTSTPEIKKRYGRG